MKDSCPHCGGVAGVLHPALPDLITGDGEVLPGAPERLVLCNCRDQDPAGRAEAIQAIEAIVDDLDRCYFSLWCQYQMLPDGYDFEI